MWVMGFCVLYYQTIIFTGIYQRWSTYALKPKSVSDLHFRAKSKKTQSLGKNGCRQKCLDKSLLQNIFRKDLLKITHRNKTQLEKDLKLLEKILNTPEELDNFIIINNNETSGNDRLTK